MILRVLLFCLMGVGLTGFGVFAWRAMHQPAPVAQTQTAVALPPPVMVNILVAAHDLRPGSFLRPDDLSITAYGQDAVPPGAERDTAAARGALSGALVERTILHDIPISRTDLLLSGDHGFLAAILAPGMRAFTIERDQVVADAGLIWPGDRLDVILTQQPSSAGPLGRQIVAETVLTNLRVLAIDQQLVHVTTPADDKTPALSTITVEVSPSDAERLAVALRLGKIAFVVRPTVSLSTAQQPLPMLAAGTPVHATGSIWAGDVMHSLNQTTAQSPSSVHVFDGGESDKEFHF